LLVCVHLSFNYPAPTPIYTLSLHDALPIFPDALPARGRRHRRGRYRLPEQLDARLLLPQRRQGRQRRPRPSRDLRRRELLPRRAARGRHRVRRHAPAGEVPRMGGGRVNTPQTSQSPASTRTPASCTFVDRAGTTWSLELTIAAVRRVKRLVGVDLLRITEPSGADNP